MFDSWDPRNNYPITRSYHLECFSVYPPAGIQRVDQLIFCEHSRENKNNPEQKLIYNDVVMQEELLSLFKENSGCGETGE